MVVFTILRAKARAASESGIATVISGTCRQASQVQAWWFLGKP